jgi:hypothetical protein
MPLVSSLDGTQTFGLEARAMFPADPPVHTMLPYTELEFPLYLTPTLHTFPHVIDAIMKSLRQPTTPLNSAFFAQSNVDALQSALHARIAEGMGLGIDRQSDWEMLLLMRRVYLESANNWPDKVQEEVWRLNDLVLQLALDAVARKIAQHLTYASDIAPVHPFGSPAEELTSEPYVTGTPAPLLNVNAEYEAAWQAAMATRPPSP